MADTEYKSNSYRDVQNIYQTVTKFENDSEWLLPKYTWDGSQVSAFKKIPVDELIDHLGAFLGAKYSMEQLSDSYSQSVNDGLNYYNDKIDQINDKFKHFKYLKRHPNEAAYCEVNGKLPEKQPIDYSDTTVSHRGIKTAIIMIISGIVLGTISDRPGTPAEVLSMFAILDIFLGTILLPVALLFSFFAKSGFHISQPWATRRNMKIAMDRKAILDADEKYRKEHDCSDEALDKEFKYTASFPAIYSTYVLKMQQLHSRTASELNKLAETVQNNIIFFPPTISSNIPHMIGIYMELETGVETWYQAHNLVSRSEEFKKMTDTVTQAIEKSTDKIVTQIGRSAQDITNKLSDVDDHVSAQLEHQTNAINYWGRTQTSIAEVQTAVMVDTDYRIDQIAQHYRK
ncbi:hypothetical protein [Companilactobacillus kimchiensis]|uniref:Uncharacterized protein n=1 Tax=Companilactobacillus kimchiensis TaxID=993692 RepID=A0A0R2L961_9LACO|nr:hypothetical protein [Companilactobacillus kimchiensis]KRN98299.1 hypothetical protein IV57_GL001215 [Companilactobacillus kimchiensis]